MKKTVHIICALILILTLIGSLQATPALALTTTFTVDTPTDAHDSNLADDICSNGVDGCSLRAAIEQAFSVGSSSNPVIIHFWSGIAGTLTLDLGPQINWAASYVTLDGESNGVTISGSGLSAGQSIFNISGSHNTISHLTIRNSPWDGVQMGDFAEVGEGNYNLLDSVTVVHSTAGGVYIHGSSSGGNDNQVVNSYIGTIPSGNSCASQYANGFDGIYIDGGAARTILNNDRIVCNLHNGVFINGTSGGAIDGTTFGYQYIGTDGSGTMGNGWNGIHLINATHTLIGGSVISGNNQAGLSTDSRAGIWLQNSNNNSVLNVSVGTNSVGTSSLGNLGDGIMLSDGSTGNQIGNALNSNTISGNTGNGVSLVTGATLNSLNYNRIGLNQASTAALPNGLAGVALSAANANTIGSPDSTVNQYISGNTREGIYINNSNLTYIGIRTSIGRGSNGVTPLGNGLQGILLTGSSSNSTIRAGSIVWNGAAGITILGSSSVGNFYQVQKNFGNGGLAVDLGNDGHTANGTHSGPPGPNNWLRYPEISGAGVHNLSGTTCANCRVDYYLASGNPIANGGGGIWLGSTTASGLGAWSTTIPLVVNPGQVTTVACKLSTGDCSEMSPHYSGVVPPSFYIFLPLIRKGP